MLTNSINAVRAIAWAQPPAVRLWLLGAPGQVMVLVWDPLAAAPQPWTAGQHDENGRGLLIVRRSSIQCGYYHPPEQYAPEYHGGKVTWAMCGPGDSERG